MIGTFSPTIAKIPHFSSFLGENLALCKPNIFSSEDVTAVAGWGRKASGKIAQHMASRYHLPCLFLEDGFLRSIKVGAEGGQPLSLVVDRQGIYYDATQPSDLEDLIRAAQWNDRDKAKAIKAIELIKTHFLSKYNKSPCVTLSPSRSPRVLVIDQTAKDLSIELGLADECTFHRMLEEAIDENPDAEILLKVHPDVVFGAKKGVLAKRLEMYQDRVTILAENINPLSLIEQVDKIYVVTSQVGFEGLLYNRPVYCYGVPWYAGWGLTIDRSERVGEVKGRRNVRRQTEELFIAAYLQYSRYIEPNTGKPGDILDVIHYLIMYRQLMAQNQGTWIVLGVHGWKKSAVLSFLYGPGNQIVFYNSPLSLPDTISESNARFLLWGDRFIDLIRAKFPYIPVYRMEDGFLRSIGLGSNYLYPVSLVVDDTGIYYDPTRLSALENTLNAGNFTDQELKQAASLRERLVALRLSKYNLEGKSLKIHANKRRVIFVPGQVENDASIHYGCRSIRTDFELLRAVRANHPDAYILYKPHPDVVSGNRKNQSKPLDMWRLCNNIVTDTNIVDCIEAADEIHTMTSLTGFEALLRGKKVVCYGLPFYAGWGLTTDLIPIDRRQRKLQLDELVAGALIRYARYVNPETGDFISVEGAVTYLEVQRKKAPVRLEHKVTWKSLFQNPGGVWRRIKRILCKLKN